MNILEATLQNKLANNFRFKEKRPGVYQLFAPFYHEDGDMYDIFIEQIAVDKFLISDFGLTLMRLSYVYDIDTPNKEKIFNRIVNSNYLQVEGGKIYLETESDNLVPAIINYAQAIGKISSMKLYQREVIHSLFIESLEEFIDEKLWNYNPIKQFHPLKNNQEYEVDFCFNLNPRPIYLFGINNQTKAKLATIACLKFQTENIPFKGVMVLENIDVLTKKDLSRMMDVADKAFTSFDIFKETAPRYFERETLG